MKDKKGNNKKLHTVINMRKNIKRNCRPGNKKLVEKIWTAEGNTVKINSCKEGTEKKKKHKWKKMKYFLKPKEYFEYREGKN